MKTQHGIGARITRNRSSFRLLCWVVLLLAASSTPVVSMPVATPQAPYAGLFRSPTRVALDATGNLYVTDSRAGQVLKLSTNGVLLAAKSNLSKPLAVAAGNQNLVYVGEEGTGRVLVFNSALTNSLFALGAGSNEFQLANHIVVNTAVSNGWIYVSDSRANQIRCYTNAALVKTIGAKGVGNGQFDFPAGVYVSPSQELFVVDQNNDRVQVFDSTGVFKRVFSLRTPADPVTTNIYGRAQGITGDSSGRLYVMDAFQGEVKVFDTAGTYLATLGGFGEWIGQLRSPGSAAIGPDQRLLVASMNNTRVEIYGIQGGLVYVTLQVATSHGSPTPAVGLYTNVSGSVLTNFVNSPVVMVQTQFVCTGWVLTGNEPASGSTNTMVMTHTNNAVLTWLWKTQYSLIVTAGVHGVASASNIWWDAGATATATATPDLHFHFNMWTGTVSSTVNPLPLLINIPQSIVAQFDANLATNATPEWWLASFNLTSQTWDAEAVSDQDGDGVLTWKEFVADTDPTNSLSFLGFSRINVLTSGVEMVWHGGILATQVLEKAAILTDTPVVWQSVYTNLPPAAISITITNPPETNNIDFFRIRVNR